MERAISSLLEASCLLQTRIEMALFLITLGKREVRLEVYFEREGEDPSTWEEIFFQAFEAI